MIFQFLILIAIFVILLHNSLYFGRYLKIIDNPDKTRKFHKLPTPLFGGCAIILVLILFNKVLYNSNIESYSLWDIIFLVGIFLIGFIDDRIGITPNKRLLALFLIFFIYFQFDENLNIKNLKFTSFPLEINLGLFSNLFLSFCSLLLINALNMTDGKNGLCASIQILIISILIIYSSDKLVNFFEYGYIFCLIIFLFYNLNGKVFLGDSGVYLGTLIIINKIFFSYEMLTNFKVEQIFMLLMIPGLDMFRLFLTRIINKKSPFKGDRNHFHHLLEKKFNNSQSLLIYLLLILIPNIFCFLYPEHTLINFIITIFIYSSIIYKLQKSSI